MSAWGGGGRGEFLPQCIPPPWTEWQTGVKTLPCCNYLPDGNNYVSVLPLNEVCIQSFMIYQLKFHDPDANIIHKGHKYVTTTDEKITPARSARNQIQRNNSDMYQVQRCFITKSLCPSIVNKTLLSGWNGYACVTFFFLFVGFTLRIIIFIW